MYKTIPSLAAIWSTLTSHLSVHRTIRLAEDHYQNGVPSGDPVFTHLYQQALGALRSRCKVTGEDIEDVRLSYPSLEPLRQWSRVRSNTYFDVATWLPTVAVIIGLAAGLGCILGVSVAAYRWALVILGVG